MVIGTSVTATNPCYIDLPVNGVLHNLIVHSIMTFKHRHNVWQRASQASILLDTKITLAKRKNYPIQEKDKK